jgi:hypothetical protein
MPLPPLCKCLLVAEVGVTAAATVVFRSHQRSVVESCEDWVGVLSRLTVTVTECRTMANPDCRAGADAARKVPWPVSSRESNAVRDTAFSDVCGLFKVKLPPESTVPSNVTSAQGGKVSLTKSFNVFPSFRLFSGGGFESASGLQIFRPEFRMPVTI